MPDTARAENPYGVGVDRRHVLPEGERAHGPRRVRPDTGERTQRCVFTRYLAVVVADDRVAARCRFNARRLYPRPDHWRTTVGRSRLRTGGGTRKARNEPPVVGHHPLDLGLLEHHLGDEDPPRVPRAAPGQVPPVLGPPLEHRRRKRRTRSAREPAGLSPRRRRRRAAAAPGRPPSSRPSACAGSSRPPRRAG